MGVGSIPSPSTRFWISLFRIPFLSLYVLLPLLFTLLSLLLFLLFLDLPSQQLLWIQVQFQQTGKLVDTSIKHFLIKRNNVKFGCPIVIEKPMLERG
jgi:hypothetical protein